MAIRRSTLQRPPHQPRPQGGDAVLPFGHFFQPDLIRFERKTLVWISEVALFVVVAAFVQTLAKVGRGRCFQRCRAVPFKYGQRRCDAATEVVQRRALYLDCYGVRVHFIGSGP
jgi:hypothetical protein